MRQRRQLEYGTQKAIGFINRTTDLFCVYLFYLLCLAFFRKFLCRPCTWNDQIFSLFENRNGKDKNFFVSFTAWIERGPLSSAPNCFSFC